VCAKVDAAEGRRVACRSLLGAGGQKAAG